MNYRIIATLGPATADATAWQALLTAGAAEFRLNTSHLTLAELDTWLEKITVFCRTLHTPPPLTLDLQASKWRLGDFPACSLATGQTIELIYARSTDRPNTLPVPHPDFFRAAPLSSAELLLNDAKIVLTCLSFTATSVTAHVTRGGPLKARKGLTFSATSFRKESLSEKDLAILERTRSFGFIRYAVSYVKDAAEMAQYRALIGPASYLIAKLERQPALSEASLMANMNTDEIWLCRGDLGAELGIPNMARAVARFSNWVPDSPIPVILAGQVLEHMTASTDPTRSEVCYLYDALEKGYQGMVLSDETAIGQYPIEAVLSAAMFQGT